MIEYSSEFTPSYSIKAPKPSIDNLLSINNINALLTKSRLTNVDCCQVRRTHEDLRKKRLDGFMSGFNTISLKLKEMYQMITLGGDAELELVDSLDPFSEACPKPLRALGIGPVCVNLA